MSSNDLGANNTFLHLSVKQMKQRLDQRLDVKIIDIRYSDDYQQGHIDGALHVDSPEARALMDSAISDPLVICCYHGISSRQFAQYLVDQGFSTVYSLDGGYHQWAASSNS